MSGTITDNLGRSSGLIKAVSAAGGKILQVVGDTHATEVTHNSTSYTDSGINVDITPSATSSKILIIATTGTFMQDGYVWFMSIFRDSTDLDPGSVGLLSFNTQNKHSTNGTGISWVDSPSSTSAITYSVRVKAQTAGQRIDTCPGNDLASITAFEIDGS
jgi:hypothetical protein